MEGQNMWRAFGICLVLGVIYVIVAKRFGWL